MANPRRTGTADTFGAIAAPFTIGRPTSVTGLLDISASTTAANALRATIYRTIQRLLHRFNLHYMPPAYPDEDTVLWCRWCGARSYLMPTGLLSGVRDFDALDIDHKAGQNQ